MKLRIISQKQNGKQDSRRLMRGSMVVVAYICIGLILPSAPPTAQVATILALGFLQFACFLLVFCGTESPKQLKTMNKTIMSCILIGLVLAIILYGLNYPFVGLAIAMAGAGLVWIAMGVC